MQSKTRMLIFYTCLFQWQMADRAAREAERTLAPLLDQYCEAQASAPAADSIAQVQQLRLAATAALKRLMQCLAEPRERLPLL